MQDIIKQSRSFVNVSILKKFKSRKVTNFTLLGLSQTDISQVTKEWLDMLLASIILIFENISEFDTKIGSTKVIEFNAILVGQITI